MAYSVIQIVPAVSTTALTCGTTINSTTVTSSAAFGSVAVGQHVQGVGIPIDTVVTAKATTSSITISKPATATAASVSLQFEYFTSAAYTSGDCLGFVFRVPLGLVRQVYITDSDKQITTAKLYFYASAPAPTADNAAFAPADADAANIIGFITVAAGQALSANEIMGSAITNLPQQLGGAKPTYCQMVTTETPTFTVVHPLTVNFVGE